MSFKIGRGRIKKVLCKYQSLAQSQLNKTKNLIIYRPYRNYRETANATQKYIYLYIMACQPLNMQLIY